MEAKVSALDGQAEILRSVRAFLLVTGCASLSQ